jgi:dienelactone hydrolase
MQATMSSEPPAVSRLRADTPPALVQIVRRALAKRPEDRYPSARALADDLSALRAPATPARVPVRNSDATMISSSANLWLQWADFFVRSGRVLVYPVYAGTYERRVVGPQGPNYIRDIMLQRGKDLRRTIDYLETRPDIDASRVAFYGISLGAQFGPLFLAIEPRFRTGVFFSGGFETWTIPAEVDPVHYTPRVNMPVLMVNGREDFDLPYATAQVPMFKMLGTPAADKKHAVFEGGHIPSRQQEPIKEMLDWLDRYLGPVKR